MKTYILSVLGLSSGSACLWYWAMGAWSGLRLGERLPRLKKWMKWVRILCLIPLGAGGIVAAGIAMRGCGMTAANATVSADSARSLGSVEASPQLLARLKRLTADRDREAKLQAQQKAADERTAQRELRRQQRLASAQQQLSQRFVVMGNTIVFSNGTSVTMTTSTGSTTLPGMPGMQQAGLRKGPFCRVTCSFHHGAQSQGTGDVEVDKGYCDSGTIPASAVEVMGWYTSRDGQYEYQSPWPGPAGGGLDDYKLYWKK